jgi:hypothetical protein
LAISQEVTVVPSTVGRFSGWFYTKPRDCHGHQAPALIKKVVPVRQQARLWGLEAFKGCGVIHLEGDV